MLARRRPAEPWGERSAARRSLALPVVLVKCSSILRVLAKQIAGRKFFPGAGMDAVHIGHHFLQSHTFREAQRPAAKYREAGSEDHAVIRVFRRGHNLFFE